MCYIMLSEINISKGFVMYTPHVSTVLKAFIYVVVILLALCSIAAIVGFVYAGQSGDAAITDLSQNLCHIGTILLVVHLITFCFVMIFQLTRLYEYIGYAILSFIATLSYVCAWLASPAFVNQVISVFTK